jgi:hypothetical protein
MTGRPHKWRDTAWKRAIADGAKDAIAYFMPDLASDMDMSREVTGRTFHVPSFSAEELREDKRPFARVMYAGRLSLESGDNVALRGKWTWNRQDATRQDRNRQQIDMWRQRGTKIDAFKTSRDK